MNEDAQIYEPHRCKHGVEIMEYDCVPCEQSNQEKMRTQPEIRCRHGVLRSEEDCHACDTITDEIWHA